mmetsp:Transcript_93753/g.264717  ORF Transcript_93753/g.264717 Transcript_93753/m.264717 type:complete len:586 (-) Transcript_93753:1875-3632(-)
MHSLIFSEARLVLGVGFTEVLDRRKVWLEILEVDLEREHASVDVGSDDTIELSLFEVHCYRPPCELSAHNGILFVRLGLCIATKLLQDIQWQLLVLLPGLLQLVAPSLDLRIKLPQRSCFLLHFVHQVDFLTFQRACQVDHLVAFRLEASEHLIALHEHVLQLVVSVQHHLSLVVQLRMLVAELFQSLLRGGLLFFRVLSALQRPLRILDHVARVQQCLLYSFPHILALFRRLLCLRLGGFQLLAADVHNLVVQIADLFLNGLVPLLDVVQLVSSRLDKFLELLQLRFLTRRQRWHLEHFQPAVVSLHLFLDAGHLHLRFTAAEVEISDFLLGELQCLFELLLFPADVHELGVRLLVRVLESLHFFGTVQAQRRPHPALSDLVAATAHRAAAVDELAVQSDDAVSRPALEADARCLLQIFGNEGVAKGEVERDSVLRLRRLDKVDKTGHILWSPAVVVHFALLILNLLQADARGAAKVFATHELDHRLCVLCAVHDDGVEHAASRGNSHVVLFRDRTEVAETPMYAAEQTSLRLLVNGLDETAAVVLLLERRLGLLGFDTSRGNFLNELVHLARHNLEAILRLRD